MRSKNTSGKNIHALSVLIVRGKAILRPSIFPKGADNDAKELDNIIYGVETEWYEAYKKRFFYGVGYLDGKLVLAEHDKVAPITHRDALKWIAQTTILVSEVFSNGGCVDETIGTDSGRIQFHSELAEKLELAGQ